MNKIVSKLYYLIKKVIKPFKDLNKWYLPNIIPLLNNQIELKTILPNCIQIVRITGAGKISIGTNCSFGFKLGGGYFNGCVELQPRYKESIIKIGNRVSTNNNLFLCAANYIEIGDNSLIGQNVTIMDHEAHGVHPNTRRKIGEIGKVILGPNVWVGNNVIILKNSEVGANTIIAAGAIVSGSFPANVIIGGVPAKVLKENIEWSRDI